MSTKGKAYFSSPNQFRANWFQAHVLQEDVDQPVIRQCHESEHDHRGDDRQNPGDHRDASKKVNAWKFLDQKVRHYQTEKDLERDGKKSQLQRMQQRHLENRFLQELKIIFESEVYGMAGIDERLIGKRGQDSLDRRVKVQPEDHKKRRENKPVPEALPGQTLPKCE